MTTRSFLRFVSALVVILATATVTGAWASAAAAPRILVFSKTAGFRHASIEPGLVAIKKLAQENGMVVDATEDASAFNDKNLKQYQAVVFLSTTGDVLDAKQQDAFERYIQAGGGWVGIHSATDTEYDWPWYGKLAGAYFTSHPLNPNVRKATFRVLDKNHPSTTGFPDTWEREDEFYNFKSIAPDLKVLIDIDETTYQGGTNGANHPMSWYHAFDGGRAWYTNMGHTDATFVEAPFLRHLLGGLRYAMGNGKLDYSKARPEENRFTKVVLSEALNEPVELALLPGDRVLFVERRGAVKLYTPSTKQVTKIATIPVSTKYTDSSQAEDGLLGLTTDPGFAKNGWVYMFYSPTGPAAKNVLSRFTMKGDSLDMSSEKVMLEVPVQRLQCCHTAGSMTFDAHGNLFLSTGDNTNPHGTGYAPIDERPDRSPWDAQKSSANTDDLRGKILRIHPEPDGSYTIPAGNLFAPGTPKTKPEIYTMGHRNPYRIAVDKRTGFLYWGDVGPDAAKDSADRGPAGHDEVGQARRPGNFGWPYFVGDNKPYYDVDFTTKIANGLFDPAHPINESPNNTGMRELPPAEKAFIWYPAGPSVDFPLMGTGGRTAMAGPVFYRGDFKNAAHSFPQYYDGKLLTYEWMRGMIFSVTMNANGDFASMERFMPSTKFANPIDMAFAPNGDLYMLEYGTKWFQGNEDARLIRIEYNAGNRAPVVMAAVDKPAGATPLTVALSSTGTADADGDALRYQWTIKRGNGAVVRTLTQANPSFTLDQPGMYTASLTTTDALGAKSSAQVQIVAGNEPPVVGIDLAGGNRTFFFPDAPIRYAAKVTDREDGTLDTGISPERVYVSASYLKTGVPKNTPAAGHQSPVPVAHAEGKRLVEAGTCLSCHQLNAKSIGPAYQAVADKYRNDMTAAAKLSTKIREGGSGVWGQMMMPPHPQLTEAQAAQIAAYVLSIGAPPAIPSLPVSGTYTPEVTRDSTGKGAVVLRAAYTDKGSNGLPGASAEETVYLRVSTVVVASGEVSDGVTKFSGPQAPVEVTIGAKSGGYVGFKGIDLTGISSVTFSATAPVQFVNSVGGKVEVRLDKPDGELLGETPSIEPSATMGGATSLTAALKPTTGKHDIYFVYRNAEAKEGRNLFILTTATFGTSR